MASILSSLLCSWSRCMPRRLPVLCSHSYASGIKGSWNKPPICKGRKIDHEEKKCHPRSTGCSGSLSACGFQPYPKCDEPQAARSLKGLKCCCNHKLTEPTCKESPKKKPLPPKKVPFKSMWETCGVEKVCPELIPRLDDTHYQISDKEKRKYTKTWNTCDKVIRKKKVCCFECVCGCDPPVDKRCKEKLPETAKEKDSSKLKVDYNVLRECQKKVPRNPNIKVKNGCIKIIMPCCPKVAKSIKCHVNHGHSKCVKECCPYPSFSECDHGKLRKAPPQECRCADIMSQCETNRFFVRKRQFSIPPPLPAWPPQRPK